MRFANYGRKSVFSDKSDSIDNQFRMSRDYCDMRFPGQIESWERYSDEDFSGANTDRPDLKRLMDDIKNGLVDALVVYQLDRLSRDVRDFANIYSVMEEHNVMFISIKESIDTATPIGRAMMYVTVVFAQMERETIATRVSDNMLGLAKKGWWTSGRAPVGYKRQRVEGGDRKHITLVQDPEGVKYMNWLFDTFLDNNYTLWSMQNAFRKQNIKTLSNSFYSTSALWHLLTCPAIVEATAEVYDYFAAMGCHIDPGAPREKWDGTCGVLIYGRVSKPAGSHKRTGYHKQSPDKWVVTLGRWKPFMSADKWLAAQAQISAHKFEKKKKYDVRLLKGVLRCSCGSLMAVSRKKYPDSSVHSSYYCYRRNNQGKEACDCRQINCNILDEKAMEIFREIGADENAIMKYVRDREPAPELNPQEAPAVDYNRQIAELEAQIDRLADSIATNPDSSAARYIVAKMEKLDLDLQALKRERTLAAAEDREKKQGVKDAKTKAAEIAEFIRNFDNFTDVERNEVVRSVVKECVWDGETLFLKL